MFKGDHSDKRDPNLRQKGLLYSMACSVLFHILLLCVWFYYSFTTKTADLSQPLEVSVITKDRKNFQVVNIEKSDDINNKRPDNAKKLAESDQSTDKERVARPKIKKAILAKKQASKAMNDSGYKDKSDPLGLNRALPKNVSLQEQELVQDAIKDVSVGDKTELNTWRFRHAPFFNRMKSRVGEMWSPQARIRENDPEGLHIGISDRVTVLKVTINTQGDLIGIKVIKDSGISYLDHEAERAFKKAAPFLFPPKELFDETGEFSFQFAFFLEINRKSFFDFDL